MTTVGYQTVNQQVYWGSADGVAQVARLTNVGPVIGGVDLPSEVGYVRRSVLGSTYPTVDTAIVSYRASIPRLRVGDESEAMRTDPQRNFAVVRTDDMRAMLTPNAIVAGIPSQAAAGGEIVSGVTVRPTSVVFRGEATELDGTTDIAVGAGMYVYLVLTDGDGGAAVGAHSVTTYGPGIYLVTPAAAGAMAIVDASMRGYLLHDMEVAQ